MARWRLWLPHHTNPGMEMFHSYPEVGIGFVGSLWGYHAWVGPVGAPGSALAL